MRKALLLWVVLFFAAAFLSGPVMAATYYVATNGNDTWPGSSSQPWATLKKAADTVAAGDTVIVRDGTYAGWHVYGNKGTSSNPITFKAENAGGVTLNAKASNASQNGIIELEGGSESTTTEYWVVDGFVVNGNNKSLMTVDARWVNHCTFRNLTVYQSSSRGLYVSHGNYNLTENCVSHDNGEHGSYCANAGTYNTFVKNTCYSNTAEGMQTNGDLSMGGNGLGLYYVYEKNVIYSNPDKGLNFDGCSHSTVKNNLVYNNMGGIALFQIDGAEGSSDDLIYNNTIITPSSGQWCIVIRSSDYTHSPGPDPVGNKIKNNILYNYRTDGSHGAICTYSSSASGFESDYNVVVNVFSVDDESTFINLTTWRTYGYDTHSIISDPASLFVNPGANDYHLKSGSPAINAGTTLTEVTDDMDGNSRPSGGAYDIGCYEYLSGPPADLVITTTSLPNGQVGVAYSQGLQATGGVQPYAWSVTAGSLPQGLSLNGSTGVISGTPTQSQTAYFTVQVLDSQQPPDSDTQALSITISPAAPLNITTTSLPNAKKNKAYSQTLQATGGLTPYTWSLASGTLPPGLSLNSSTGVISGSATSTGTWPFTARVTDSQVPPATDDQPLSITVRR